MNPLTHITRPIALAMLLGALALASCEEKKPPPPPPPPPKPVVRLPDPVDINGVLSQLKPDSRVQFPQAQAPVDKSLAEAVIKLASALAKGDAAAMRPMLDSGAKAILEDMVASGAWAEATKPIEQVRIVSLSGRSEEKASSAQVALAIQIPGSAHLLAWQGSRAGDAWVFKNIWVQDDRKTRASEFDGVSIQSVALGDDAPAEGGKAASGGEAGKAPPGKAAPVQPPGTTRKNTPAGPVNVPTSTPSPAPSSPGGS